MPDVAWRSDLIDTLQQPIWTARADGTILRANAFWHAYTGIPAGDALGRWWDVGLQPEDVPDIAERWSHGIQDSDPFEIDYRFRRADGSWHWYLARVAPVSSDTGETGSAWVAFAIDIDERRKARDSLRASESRLRDIVTNANDIIYTLQLDGMFADINPAVERVLGYTPEEMLAQPFERIIAVEQIPLTRSMLARKLAGEPSSTYELDVTAKSGHRVTLEISSRLVYRDGEPFAVHGVARDISSRRQRISHAELSAAVGTALTRLQTLDQQLQASTQAIVDHMGAAFARIWLVNDADPNTLVLHASAGQYTHLDGAHSRIQVGKFKIGRIALSREPFFSNDVQTDPEVHDRQWARREGMVAFAGYPIVLGDRLLGVVGLFSRHRLDATTQSVLGSVTDALAVAIERDHAERSRDTLFRREQDARVWAEVAESRYRDLFEGVADAILVTDDQLRVQDANAAAHEMLGYDYGELIHAPGERLFSGDFSWSQELRGMLLEAGRWQGELELIRKDGQVIPVEVRTTVVQMPSGPVYLSAGRDISERKHLERLQRDFLAMVTHDIRTPLTSIKGWLQLLRRRPYLQDQDRRIVGRSLDQTEKINHLIDDLADLVRIEAGQLTTHPEPDDLLAIIGEQITQVQEQAANHELCLETPERMIEGVWDRPRLGQVFENLLSNAVKYSPDGGAIMIRVTREEEWARIEIDDHGIGISSDHLPLLFERFYREDATGAGGLGLGLHITRMLVEAHGGTIAATSEPGEGSTFIIALPVVPAGA